MLHKIKVKGRDIVFRFLIKSSLVLNSPKLTAIVFSRSIRKLNDRGKYKVLCLRRTIFMEDVQALVEYGEDVQYSVLEREYIKIIFRHFLTKSGQEEVTGANYHLSSPKIKGIKKYNEYLNKMLPQLIKLSPFDAFLTANFNYVESHELAKVAEKHMIPFIILHKEAMVVSSAYHNFIKNYKDFSVYGSKMMFYNKQCMEGFLSLNLPGLTSEKAELVGIPRFDFIFSHIDNSDQTKKQITFFAFLPKRTFRFLTKDSNVMNRVEQRTKEFFGTVRDYALKHPDTKIIIKTKSAQFFVDYVKGLMDDDKGFELENLEITNFGNVSNLIKNSMAVIGFNSTTLIEAIVAKKMIISPYYGDIFPNASWTFFENHPQIVRYVKQASDLEDLISECQNNFEYNKEARASFLGEYISTTQGGASRLVEKIIINTINKYKSKKSN